MFKFNIFYALILFALCPVSANSQSILKNGKLPADLEIKLERGPCYGDCPEYSLTIKADGKVTFGEEPEEGVEEDTEQVSKANLLKLVRYFEAISFMRMRNRYAYRGDGCGRVISDSPTQTIRIRANGRKKEIYYDFGCTGINGNIDAKLAKLGRMIDLYANSARWLTPADPEPSEEATEPNIKP